MPTFDLYCDELSSEISARSNELADKNMKAMSVKYQESNIGYYKNKTNFQNL